ncbi:hypothetical protein VRRI112168_02325 [Vreelandella rituensis]|uniref:Uncharacterized protein n=1 Tax=Vreelandella rituensis TaxID=2282306 RepID=A0A368U9G5_9GAMM|nr:hypothetical protein [Halomonas rituensis]RCV93585.1 hypothetical protein DU506_00070 [Halomonas rituensis]
MTYSAQDYYDADNAMDQALENWEAGIEPYEKVEQAESALSSVITYLRANGTMPKTRHEMLEDTLDLLYPEAASREIVTYEGERYQRRFRPLKRGKGGGVVKWEKSWSLVLKMSYE